MTLWRYSGEVVQAGSDNVHNETITPMTRLTVSDILWGAMKKEWRVSGLRMLWVQSSLLCNSEVREKKLEVPRNSAADEKTWGLKNKKKGAEIVGGFWDIRRCSVTQPKRRL